MTGDRSTNANITVAALVATVLVVVTTILLITFGAWAYRSERADRNAQLMRSINVEADQIAVSLALPIWNIDRPQIARVIQGLDSIPEIEAIVVNGGGTTYALTRNNGARLVPMNGRVPMEGLIVRDRDIRFGGERIGTVIWATGFRPELRHLAPLKLREKEGGVTVGQGSSWKDPRIFFAGYGPQASTIGANRAGRQIARQVVAQLSNL